MNKKHFKKTAALLLALGMTFGATACDSFFVTDNLRDLQQTVATVDISDYLTGDYAAYANKITEYAPSTDIKKRELVASFLTIGYTLVQSYGMSYEEAFNTLMTELTNNKLMTQYAVAYYLHKADTIEGEKSFNDFKTEQTSNISQRQKELYEKYPEVLTMKYFLTDFGKTDDESMKEYNKTVYSLKKSLNQTIDSNEQSFIEADDEEHNHEEARTLPTNVNTETEDYVPAQYEVYTGFNGLADCGEYEEQDGSTSSTRRDAYRAFLSSLRSYGLIQKNENVANVEELEYYYLELSSALSAALLEKYYDESKEVAMENLTEAIVESKYEALLQGQEDLYKNDHAAFETALGAVKEDSYLLYGLENYGFVYNILIPFSPEQNQAYTAIKSKGLQLDAQYKARESLLAGIEAKDLRGSWFSEHDHANYSYKDGDSYYFFEDNTKNTDKYEKLTHYAGQYAYQGTVDESTMKATPTGGMKIVGENNFIDEMEGYINFLLNNKKGTSGVKYASEKKTLTDKSGNPLITVQYGQDTDDDGFVYTNAVGKVDNYAPFIYYTGKVAGLENETSADYFNPNSDSYTALSAVNELMFAYSTDLGCLNTYMGYAASAHKTNFVSEFEYAAHLAVKGGVGTYVVVPSDYGWHIVYCSYRFDVNGAVFGTEGYNHLDATGKCGKPDCQGEDCQICTNKPVEGSFSYLFYETLKESTAASHANAVKNAVLNQYYQAVKLYQDKYQDLLDLE